MNEYQRGTISELLESIAATPLKGECLLIVEGASQDVEEKDVGGLVLRNPSPYPARHEEKSSYQGSCETLPVESKASSTLPITIGKKMTKQGSCLLPFVILVEEKIERICGC